MNTILVTSTRQLPDFSSHTSSDTKSVWSHFSDRLGTSEGIYDALKIGEYGVEWFKRIPLQIFQSSHLADVKGVFSRAAAVLGAFALVKQMGDTASSISLFGRVFDKTRSPSSQDLTIDVLAKNAARNILDLTCMASDVANNFHEAGWVNLGKAAPISSGVFFGTDIIGNAIDLTGQIYQISERNVEKHTRRISPQTKTNFFHKDVLSCIEIVKNVACISGSIIGLASLVLGGPIVVSIVGLFFSSMWIVSKIVSHFYNEMVVKEQPRSLRIDIR